MCNEIPSLFRARIGRTRSKGSTETTPDQQARASSCNIDRFRFLICVERTDDECTIGAYTHCSFTSRGEGTFFGGEGANPAVGATGRLERVSEVRLEMSFHKRHLAAVIAALRAAHPYEEPAFDIFALEPHAGDPRVGSGRVARLATPANTDQIASRLEPALGCGRIQRSRNTATSPRVHGTFAVCAGSGASLLEAAAAQGATLFVTGELSHHDVLRAHALGLEVLLAGHTNTERGYLPRLASALAATACIECTVSVRDRDPLGPG